MVRDDNWKTTGHSKHSSPLVSGLNSISVGEGSKLSQADFFPDQLEIVYVLSYQAPPPTEAFHLKYQKHLKHKVMPNHNPHLASLKF